MLCRHENGTTSGETRSPPLSEPPLEAGSSHEFLMPDKVRAAAPLRISRTDAALTRLTATCLDAELLRC